MTSTYIPTSDIELPKDMSKLVDYRWNDFVCGHYFCKTCGVHTFIGDPKYGYRINLGCVEGLDALTLNIDIIDGRSMPISGNPGPHPGE